MSATYMITEGQIKALLLLADSKIGYLEEPMRRWLIQLLDGVLEQLIPAVPLEKPVSASGVLANLLTYQEGYRQAMKDMGLPVIGSPQDAEDDSEAPKRVPAREFVTARGCKVTIHPAYDSDMDVLPQEGVMLCLSMEESLPSGVRRAEVYLTPTEIGMLQTLLTDATIPAPTPEQAAALMTSAEAKVEARNWEHVGDLVSEHPSGGVLPTVDDLKFWDGLVTPQSGLSAEELAVVKADVEAELTHRGEPIVAPVSGDSLKAKIMEFIAEQRPRYPREDYECSAGSNVLDDLEALLADADMKEQQ